MDMNFTIDNNYLENTKKLDINKFQKMVLIYNALEEGWNIKKKDNLYFFSKPHENKKEVMESNYLYNFLKSSLDINKI
jgi:hypothetical protein